MERVDTWLVIAPREVSESPELLVTGAETVSTAVSPTISLGTALKEAHLASVERERVRAKEVITAIDAVIQGTLLGTARCHPQKVHPRVEEEATVSVVANPDIWPETALTQRPAQREDPQDKATASSAVSSAILREIAELNEALWERVRFGE